MTEIPRDFGWRYVLWLTWSNAITILAVIQGVLSALMVTQGIFDHTTFQYLAIGNAILTAIVAQVKRNKPPGPPPRKHHHPKRRRHR
jgi:hypothetical protein